MCCICLNVCVCLHSTQAVQMMPPTADGEAYLTTTRKKKKWKIKTEHAKTKPGSSATQHNYYFANVGALKKCLQEIQSGALAPARWGRFSGKYPLAGFFVSAWVRPVQADGWMGVGSGSAAGYCSSLLESSTYSELRGLMKESFKRSKPDWLVLLLRRGHLWQELLLQRQ